MTDTFYLDGVSAKSKGIWLVPKAPVKISPPKLKMRSTNVPGKNGAYTLDEKSFEDRKATVHCFNFARNGGVEQNISTGNKFLFATYGPRKLSFSDDPDHYWIARVKAGMGMANRAGIATNSTIEFVMDPRRFRASGDKEITVNGSTTLFNDGAGIAKPLIKIPRCTNQPGTITINGITMRFDYLGQDLTVDCEEQSVYSPRDNHDNRVIMEQDEFLCLPQGKCFITLGGYIKTITIQPRWWDL